MGWSIIVTADVRGWLEVDCHPQLLVRRQVMAKFEWIFRLLEDYGPKIGKPYIDHIEGYDGLWEVRVEHGTGAYRAFFGILGERMLVIACGAVKKADRFPPRVYETAYKKVRGALQQARLLKEGGADDGRSL